MSRILKAVFFDLDETLITNQLSVRELFARMYHNFENQLGSDSQTVFFTELRALAPILWSTMFDSSDTPEQQFIACFARCIESTKAANGAEAIALGQKMFEHYLSLSADNVVFHDGAERTLAALRENDVVTGLITNGIEQVQLNKVHSLNIQDKVDHITVSAQARAHKPHAPVFKLALQRAGVSANAAIQVGDHATNDVAGAIRAGLGGVFYNPGHLLLEESFANLNERPTHHIKHLKEVLHLI